MSSVEDALAQRVGRQHAAALLPHFHLLRLQPGAALVQEGVRDTRLLYVCEGSLDVTVGEAHVGIVPACQWVGEVGFVDGGPASATCTTREPTVVLEMDRVKLDLIIMSEPGAAGALMREINTELTQRLRAGSAMERGVQPSESGRWWSGWLAHFTGRS